MDGLQGILRNIQSVLKSEGIIEIEALGTPFDPVFMMRLVTRQVKAIQRIWL